MQKKETIESIVKLANACVNKPFKMNAYGPNDFDQAGLVQYVFKQTIKKELSHKIDQMFKVGQKIEQGDIEAGDILFFDIEKKNVPNHVGIYLGNNEMIHCMVREGVRKV